MAGNDKDAHSRLHRFASTHWSIIRRAGNEQESSAEDSAEALQALCEAYWFPIYSYVRNKGYEANTAADLTQGFFAELLRRKDFRNVKPELGKFRSFLLASLKHFISNHWEKENALKRGGGQRIVSFDAASADSRYKNEPAQDSTPENHFQKQWALAVLEQANQSLREYYSNRKLLKQFERLQVFLAGKSAESRIGDVAKELSMTEVAAKVAIHRMRRKFGEILRTQIEQTVSSSEEVDEEIRQMFDCLRQ